MGWLIKKYPRIALLLVNVALLILLLGLIELFLKSFAPFYVATIGHQFCENADKYGYGFLPHESLKTLDPDTGEIYFYKTNNHGWRDRDRQYDNEYNAYRILVLGDSATFGGTVPAHKVYTRILENKLREEEYNIEVINIAYGGWGTDQQLEALVNEGVKYNPNLIIVQFTKNDITDNAYYYHALNKNNNAWLERRGWKPFYYELDQNNMLHRRENPYFRNSEPKTLKERIMKIIRCSEILKRLYAVYLHYSLKEQTNYKGSKGRGYDESAIKYRVTNNQILQLKTVIGLSGNSNLYNFLQDHQGMVIPFERLSNAVETSNYRSKKNVIFRILEDRKFHRHWSVNAFKPHYVDAESYYWKLYFALIDEIKKQANLIGADVAIFPTTEEGHYYWNLSWYRVSGDKESKKNHLSHIQVIRSAMKEKGIDVIENTIPYQRARNDPHANVEGHQAMADDVFKYMMLRKDELEEYKNLTNP